jgi:hypothetical protein
MFVFNTVLIHAEEQQTEQTEQRERSVLKQSTPGTLPYYPSNAAFCTSHACSSGLAG